MAGPYHGPLEKIDDYRWRIPKSYMQGMRVDGIIYASQTLIDQIKKDSAPQQVANVATLPGIVKNSLAMPDIHWGYGFSIGGVAATDVDAGGVISPGGVGYDINCLCGNSFILDELGYRLKIRDYEKKFPLCNIRCMDFNKETGMSTRILGFLKQKNKKKTYVILTETGRQITATEDHPFYTKDGMRQIRHLSKGGEVAIYPFEGVEYENPSADIIIDKETIEALLIKLGKGTKGNAINQILRYLENKNILPLKYNSFQLPYLLKIMGYCLGDGVLYFETKRNKGITGFYGKEKDLQEIKDDLKTIGFNSKIYSRHRSHCIATQYRTVEFERKEFFLRINCTGFAALMLALGFPSGNKCRQAFELPQWIFKAPLWQKRLFLAGFFGAELSSPKTMKGHGYNFYSPILSMNKTENYIGNGKQFLKDISKILDEFGVKTNKISQRLEFINKDGLVSYRIRLILSNKTENLINLYGRVGFGYNSERKFLGNMASQYLRLKEKIIKERKEVASLAPALANRQEWSIDSVYNYLESPYVNKRFIERSLYETRATAPRVCNDALTFDEFKKATTEGLGRSGMTWDRIEDIVAVEHDDWVYDFTVEHPHHNFIANSFVVSNCGVRLVKTNLSEKDIRHKIKDLVYGLYHNIPAGIGSKGQIRVSEKEEAQILVKGSGWALSKGYATENDIECTEENGAMEGADPDAVSERAYERGKRQPGTLGAGNHFVEVQVIDEVYDEEAARVFAIDKGQVCVMIHTGSRGFGYQVCDDYAKGMVSILSKYNINVPDRQLACAPLNSKDGQRYFGAMKCAANYAWNNRQCITHFVRLTFEKVFGESWQALNMSLVYDVAHNIAKLEKHIVDGKEKDLCVHRKGATRAFGPGSPEIPQIYKGIGQPVIIPGDMGTHSYLLVGTQKAMEETFGTTCHGAGRCMSRTAASHSCTVNQVRQELEEKGIVLMAASKRTILEEAPKAYKDVNEVVNAVDGAGISKKVCRMRPLGVIKG